MTREARMNPENKKKEKEELLVQTIYGKDEFHELSKDANPNRYKKSVVQHLHDAKAGFHELSMQANLPTEFFLRSFGGFTMEKPDEYVIIFFGQILCK